MVLILGGLAVGVVVAWRCWLDPAIPFLSVEQPAEWIVYPLPWQLTARQVKERRVRFRTTLDLPSAPHSGRVRLRAFRGYTLFVNGTSIGGDLDLESTWKSIQRHDVTAALRAGENRIEVEVRHITAPPALWLVLNVDGTIIKTDRQWQARLEGGSWSDVRLATDPMEHPIVWTSPSVADGWRKRWSMVLLWLGIATVVTLAIGRWLRLDRAGDGPARIGIAPDTGGRRAELVLLACVVALVAALCVNNLSRLPPVVGFDSPAHLEYIGFLRRQHRLPLASDGWEMYQPPLYYVVSACGAALGRSAGWDDADTAVPKLVSMISGIAQVVLIACILTMLFPDSRPARCAGLILAAALPMNLYISQYPSNEMMSVALVTAALASALRAIRDAAASWRRYAVPGLLLGLAMLAKHTALLALVTVVGVFAGRVLIGGVRRWRLWLSSVGVTVLTVLLVAGWYSARNVIHFGNPFIGNWNPASDNVWWQDPGYGTSAYYFRFGRSLTQPFHSCLYSYADGIYSTIWGDGMCAGIADVRFRPPWHYDLMAVGFSLAWLPTVLIAIGLLTVLLRWVRRPTATWALVVGHGLLVGFAVFYMTLKLPYYAQAKGFYGLSAMAGLCAFGACGFNVVARWLGRYRIILWVVLLAWAINAYASFFVWPRDAQTHFDLGEVFTYQGKPDRGLDHFRRALRSDPNMIAAYGRIGAILSNQRRYAEARQAWRDGLARDPNDVELLSHLAWLLATCPNASVRNGAAARDLALRACSVTPAETPFLLDALAAAQAETGRFDQAVRTMERAVMLAQSQARPDLLPSLRERLAMYEARRPYHQPQP